MKTRNLFPAVLLVLACSLVALGRTHRSQEKEPQVVEPGPIGGPPADATVVFDGKSLANLRGEGHDDPQWKLGDGYMEVTNTGGLFSKAEMGDCQIHVEWAEPAEVKGEGQGRGNSGVYVMGRFEIQVLDSYNNKTYPNGQCGAVYGRYVPLVNVSRKPGDWQTYDIVFHAPKKDAGGKVENGTLTVFQNGVLIQDHVSISDEPTPGAPLQGFAEKGPLYLQDHGGDKVRFRNVWMRPL